MKDENGCKTDEEFKTRKETGADHETEKENDSSTAIPTSLPFRLPPRLFDANDSVVLHCIDCHAGGEPARIVLAGLPELPLPPSSSALEKRNYMMDHMDHYRQLLLLEPRGYPCQNADFVFFPSEEKDAQQDGSAPPSNNIQYVIAEHNKIYPLMSGHNTICVATALWECGLLKGDEAVLEAPSGPIRVKATWQEDRGVASITLINTAPAFVERLDVVVDVPAPIGPVTVDIAYGGMWYAIVDIAQFDDDDDNNMTLDATTHGRELCSIGERIKVACREQHPVQHPTEDYPGVDILAFRDSKTDTNAVIMSNHNRLDWNDPSTWTAMIDRSPCGTGTCAIMATLHARGLLQVGDRFVHTSIIGSQFIGTIVEETTLEDGRPAIIPQIEGSACITQYSQVVVDPSDPFPKGFRVGDIW